MKKKNRNCGQDFGVDMLVDTCTKFQANPSKSI